MADTLVFTDAFTGAVNTGWSSNWSTNNVGGGVINLDGSGHGRISATANGAASKAFTGGPDSDDYDFTIKINRSGTGSASVKYFIAPVADNPTGASGSFPFSNAAWLEGNLATSHNAVLKVARNGTVTTGATITMGTFATGVYMGVRLRKEGNTLYAKVWDASGAEPGSWTQTWDITGIGPVGGSGQRRPFVGLASTVTSSAYLLVDDASVTSISTVVNGGYTAEPMTSTALLVDPVVTAIRTSVATNFNDTVDPFGTLSSGSKSVSTGDLVISATSGFASAPLTGFAFVSGGESLIHVASVGSAPTVKVGFGFGGRWVEPTVVANDWVRVRHNGTDIQYKKWQGGASEPASWTTGPNNGVIGSNGSLNVNPSASSTIVIDYFAANQSASVAFPDSVIAVTPATASGLLLDPTVSLASNVNYAVVPALASALLVDPTFSNVTNKTVNVTAATATALAPDVTVSVVRFVDYAVEPFVGSGVGPLGGFSVPISVVASPATASGTAPDASVSAERNALVSVQPAISTGVLAGILLNINGEVINPELVSDRYRQRLLATTDTEDFWYRLDESSGTTLADARGNALKIANLFGSYSFNVYGPESRKAIHMENGYFAPQVNGTPDSKGGIDSESTSSMTFEIVLRTTDANGVLAYGLDNRFQSSEFRNAVYLKDGKVSVEWNRLDGGPTPFSLTGFKNVADGQWHHIVVTAGARSAKELDNGVRIYIDGKLDVRRRTELIPDLWATPDSYMGMPEAWRMVTPLYPWQDNITADVMEVVFRKDADLVQDEAIELFYAAFGIVPVRVQPATAVGVMPEASAKGNQPRALVLYTRWYGGSIVGNRIGDERNAPSSTNGKIPDEFDHDIEIGRIFEPGENQWIDLAGFRVVPVSIMREDVNPLAGPYRNPVTDLPRLLNLQEDLNMDDYDVILFRNWPDEGADLEVFRARGYSNGAIEDFLGSVKQAVVDGMGLEITSPNLASRLGLISSAQPIPMLRNAEGFGEKDLRGAMLNPWDRDKEGKTYLDMHANNWHRVVANVENLTNGPEESKYEYISDAFLTYNPGTNGEVNNVWGYDLSNKPLEIGDEIIDSTEFFNRITTYEQSSLNSGTYVWDRRVWAVTPDGLTVGTPLYKFGSQMWDDNTLVDNPYREFIGGAVVQPGDVWGGQRIAGKVFMNFAEVPWSAARNTIMTRQIVPPNEEIENPGEKETEEMRKWDYAFSRLLFISGRTPGQPAGLFGTATEVEMQQTKDGKWYAVEKNAPKDTSSLPTLTIVEKYPTEPVVVANWFVRGMAWLASKDVVSDGSVTIRPTAALATGELVQPKVVAQKSVTVNAQAAIANGQMVSPDEVAEPDVTVFAFPAYASGVMTGYGKTIAVAPFEGSGVLVDNFDLISASGEQVVLYLHRLQEVELFIKEGTK